MNESLLHQWINESEESRRLYAQEKLIIDVSEQLWVALEKQGWTRTQLAEALHTSKSNVTQMLNGGRNMTLRTLADIAHVLESWVNVRICDRSETDGWETAEAVMPRRRIKMLGSSIDAANANWTEPRVVA